MIWIEFFSELCLSKSPFSCLYDDHSGSYSELTKAKNEPTIRQQNIKTIMKKINNFENDLCPSSYNGWHVPSSEEYHCDKNEVFP